MTARREALRQARRMIARTIEDNPLELTLARAETAESGAGLTVPDPYGSRYNVQARGRIAPMPYGAQRVGSPEITSAGVGVTDRQFILVTRGESVLEGDVLEYNGYEWTVGPVQAIYRFGGVVGKQAPLQKGAEIEVTT